MIIDVHTHIFPKEVRENRARFFPSEAAFELLYQSPGSSMVGAKEIIDSMDEQEVDVSVVFGFPWKDPDISKRHNDYILESVSRYPKRLVGLCCLDPFSSEAASEVERCLDGGLAGVGELAFYESGIDENSIDRLEPIMNICLERNRIALIHTNEPVGHIYPGKSPNTLVQIYKMITRFPENKIILAHWGGGIFFYNLLKKEVKESLKNVYFDTAASPYLYDPEIYRHAIILAGAEKVLFGSDFPLLKPERYVKELDHAGISDSEKQSICGKNAKILLNLK